MARSAGGPDSAGLTSDSTSSASVEADPHRPRRRGLRAGHALRVHPQQRQHAEREADVQERQQREQPVVDRLGRDEVADQRAVEHRQPVEPLGGGDGDELRDAVPRQHVAVDAGDVDEPQQDDAGDPREPAEAAVVVERRSGARGAAPSPAPSRRTRSDGSCA